MTQQNLIGINATEAEAIAKCLQSLGIACTRLRQLSKLENPLLSQFGVEWLGDVAEVEGKVKRISSACGIATETWQPPAKQAVQASAGGSAEEGSNSRPYQQRQGGFSKQR